ncbi:hypothetical protein J5N97_021910 [Dioscorea zingiberensis]|uniref:Pollen Ole e 1 allergen and extensin family protein n=1 Tax=Dioscorea zingiberensis TaxID=325984 RepID=A0A9D5HAH2_9LILI|nr:hypothetical protein J5N97_021910 [Dioscorea zingiberensis]
MSKFILFFLLTIPAISVSVLANTMVSGTVFCDQCLDGSLSLFDYPLSGAKIAVTCNGAEIISGGKSNWVGSWMVRIEGSRDLSGCEARVVAAPAGCAAAVGGSKGLSLMFKMFGMELYTVAPLLAQPSKPMRLCHNAKPAPSLLPPPAAEVQPPPPPQLLPLLPPPLKPFFEASACPYYKWMMPEYKCYWRVMKPETKVAAAFGLVAGSKYGSNMTLWQGLHGKRELYQTLLREAITALLNSCHSAGFSYPTLRVIGDLNLALLGSQRQALLIALRFRRANAGAGSGPAFLTCNLSPCS